MLTRIFVILALVAGLAVIALTHFTIKPHLQQIIDTRDYNGQQWTNQWRRADKLQATLTDTEKKLVATETDLKDTRIQLGNETARANQQTDRANNLQKNLTETQAKLTDAQQQLAAWDALGYAVDQIKAIIKSEKDLRAVQEVLKAEKVILSRNNKVLKDQLDQLIGPDDDVPLPVGTRGRVLVVDPKWKFVILDLGDSKGMRRNGVLMVSRSGKLVAKVRIMSVYEDRCIANVVSGWDFGEILEGDAVIY